MTAVADIGSRHQFSNSCTNNKWHTFQLNSKFDKTSNFIQKSYHYLISAQIDSLFL